MVDDDEYQPMNRRAATILILCCIMTVGWLVMIAFVAEILIEIPDPPGFDKESYGFYAISIYLVLYLMVFGGAGLWILCNLTRWISACCVDDSEDPDEPVRHPDADIFLPLEGVYVGTPQVEGS